MQIRGAAQDTRPGRPRLRDVTEQRHGGGLPGAGEAPAGRSPASGELAAGDPPGCEVPGDRLILVSGRIGSGPDGTITTVADVIKITACVVDFDEDFPIHGQAPGTAFDAGPAGAARGAAEVTGPAFEIPAAAFAPADSRLGSCPRRRARRLRGHGHR